MAEKPGFRCELCSRSLDEVGKLNIITLPPRKKWNISCTYENESMDVKLVCDECLSKFFGDDPYADLWNEVYEWVARERNPDLDLFTDEQFLKWIRRLETKKLMELSLIIKGEIECLTKTCFGRELEEMIFRDLQEVVKAVTLETLRFVRKNYITMKIDGMEELK